MNNELNFSRRDTLKSISSGFGYLAFAGLAHAAAEMATRWMRCMDQPCAQSTSTRYQTITSPTTTAAAAPIWTRRSVIGLRPLLREIDSPWNALPQLP